MTALDDQQLSIRRDAERDAMPFLCPGCNEAIDERADGSLVSERYQGERYHDFGCYVMRLERDAEAYHELRKAARNTVGQLAVHARTAEVTGRYDRLAECMEAELRKLNDEHGLYQVCPFDWRDR